MADYVPYYCEENIWRLLAEEAPGERWAVLVFGRGPSFAMRRQNAGRPGDGLVFWDYHAVALMRRPGEKAAILDFDTALGFETEAATYLEECFRGIEAPAEFAPLFRVIQGPEYVRRLYSDRSHMKTAEGSWIAPPPAWRHPGADLPEGERWPLMDLLDPAYEPYRTEPTNPAACRGVVDLSSLGDIVESIDADRFR